LATYRRARSGGRRRARGVAAIALLSTVAGAGCTQVEHVLASVPVFAFMRNSPAFDPYEHPLPPAPGSVPFESPLGPALPALEATEQALNAWATGPWGQNPLAADDAAALALGQVMYDRHCTVCHGLQGRGDGPVIGPGRFPFAPSLLEGVGATREDGYVYAIIRAGRGLMPAYGTRMTHVERWAVVNYVNHLQAQYGAAPQPAPPDAAAAAAVAPAAAAPAAAAPTDTTPPQQ
jgi:mono/diheme cytochrome c family protein